MPFTLTMPKLSPTMEGGTIVKWHKSEGEHVDADDLIIEVATDKATVEYRVLDGGWLRKILVNTGQEALINQAIAIFTESADESIEGYQPEGIKAPAEAKASSEIEESAPSKAAAKTVSSSMPMPTFVPEAPLADYQFVFPTADIEGRIKASPLARKLAREQQLDLATVKGTGPGGRIMSRDLQYAQPVAKLPLSTRQVPDIAPGSYTEEALTPMRKVIGQRLQEAKTFIPHFYVSQNVDAAPLTVLREQLAISGIKITFNDFVVRACALALSEHPMINSGFNSEKQNVIHFQTVDIAVAVSLPAGLITPIIRHANYKKIGEISVEMRSLAKKAKAGKLQPEEYKGGSFTISNLGMFGVTQFQAIINPPQAAILAVSGIIDTPVVKNGSVVAGKVMGLTLSVDHRVIDGVAAAEFINRVKTLLEQPAVLLL
jgi:pyruvate dehydrogenase E2 component (dihydrolipoamide acetyltransferase)